MKPARTARTGIPICGPVCLILMLLSIPAGADLEVKRTYPGPGEAHEERGTRRTLPCSREEGRPVPPGEWVNVRVNDMRNMWRINCRSTAPVDVYLLYPGTEPGDPPDRDIIINGSRKHWTGITSIEDERLLPRHHDYGSGREWDFYVYNSGEATACFILTVDMTGKPTTEEMKTNMIIVAIFFLAALAVIAAAVIIALKHAK